MTTDAQIRERLHAAVDDTSAPPSFATAVLAGGRARRRRRQAAGGLAVALVVTLGASLLVRDEPAARRGEVVDSGPRTFQAAMDWARSLPEGEAADLPYFGEGGLHDGDQVVAIPDTVARWISPDAVDGGWLVGLDNATELAPAVLSPDGSLRPLPPYPFPERAGGSKRWVVSQDGARVAYGDQVLDLATFDTTQIPHDPFGDSAPGHLEKQRLHGWTEDGLVFEGSPSKMGMGSHYLLRDDGETIRVDDPPGVVAEGWAADLALGYRSEEPDDDLSEMCGEAFRLVGTTWVEQSDGCLRGAADQVQDVSPDGRWVLTSDVRQIWDVPEGRFSGVGVPTAILAAWAETDWQWKGLVGWESADTLLLPVLDRGFSWAEAGADEQQLQVVRCTMSTGDCERAGEEQTIRDEVGTPGGRFDIIEFASRQ